MPRKWSIATSVWPTRGFRVLKQDIAIAPMHHRLRERIRAHGLICFLALLLYRVMRTQLTDHSPSAALRQLKALQLHRLSAGGQSIRGISQAKDETRAILQQLDLPLPEPDRL
jgi:transposase